MNQDVIDASKKLEEAARIKEALRQIDHFIYTIDVGEKFPRQTTSWCKVTTITEVKSTYTLFGQRWFGGATSDKLESNINIPPSLLKDLAKLAKARRKVLMNELNEILK